MNWTKPQSGVYELIRDGQVVARVRRRRIDARWIIALPQAAAGSPVSPAYGTVILARAAAEKRLTPPPAPTRGLFE